jgi:hypothetical protein
MQARIDELLSLRDGAPVDARVRAHVDRCADCAATLAGTEAVRARLRALPQVQEPGVDGWTDLQSRLARPGERRRRLQRAAPYAAAASVAALALFVTLRGSETAAPPEAESRPLIVLETESIDELRARSQALEAVLAALPERPAVERAATSVPIESLEAEVQWLDHQLSLAGADAGAADPATARLWRDRVEVMNSLAQLRYVEAQHVSL